MPQPVFDVEQYELRGTLPKVYSAQQTETLNRVLNRVQGQLDWTAQLLGFNGPNYWGTKLPAADGRYKWKGLPETASEKRALQSGAFGVYNKNKDYEVWPAPFNRAKVGAAGDQAFSILEERSTTILVPESQNSNINYKKNPFVYIGGFYTFDSLIDVEILNGDAASLVVTQNISANTASIRVVDSNVAAFSVKRSSSAAVPFILFTKEWTDPSDWNIEAIKSAFLGIWGSKGNQLSYDLACDALNLHGFSEKEALTLDTITKEISVETLLGLLGLVPGPVSALTGDNYTFHVEGCEGSYAVSNLAEPDLGVCDTGNYELKLSLTYGTNPNEIAVDPGPDTSVPIGCNGLLGLFPPACTVDNGTLEDGFSPEYLVNNGDYDGISPTPSNIISNSIYYDDWDPIDLCDETTDPDRVIDYDDLIIDVGGMPGPVLMTDPGVDNEIVLLASGGDYDDFVLAFDGPELGGFEFEYDAKNLNGRVLFPCVEWSFDPTLDNSTYFPIPAQAAWMGTDDGFYDRDSRTATGNGYQAEDHCTGGHFINGLLSFDDGEYDEIVEPNCDLPDDTLCELVDSGIYKYGVNPLEPPDVNTNCLYECGAIDGEEYVYGEVPLVGVPIIDGAGSAYLPPVDCTLYDNDTFDRTPDFLIECVLDNGGDGSPLPSETVNEAFYDKTPVICSECTLDPDPPVIPCPVTPIRVRLDQIIFESPIWRMQPSVLNSETPLRVWKNRVLTVSETYEESSVFNSLIADYNRGPEDPESYRHFLRLPIEYSRAEKFWTRAESIASNQGYFSRPPSKSETRILPEEQLPFVYAEAYKIPSDSPILGEDPLYYDEDFLVSSVSKDDTDSQPQFLDSTLKYEDESNVSPYRVSALTDYDALASRIPGEDGKWQGVYLKRVRGGSLTGYLEADLESFRLRVLTLGEDPVYDRSVYRTPNIEFPDSSDQASFSNFITCYAYFAADFSAADEPVFDPTSLHCLRDQELEGYELTGFEITNFYGDPLATENDDILETDPLENIQQVSRSTRTAYLLHTP